MRFNPKARLNTRRVSDRGRGGGGGGGLSGGGMGMPIPGGTAAGGGIGGVLIIILFLVLTQCVGGGGGLPGGTTSGSALDTARFEGEDGERYANCQTGEDANNDEDCARVAVENSLYDYWAETLPEQGGTQFRAAEQLATFTGGVQTACGGADAAVGPFYCPADESIYLDTTFFEDVLERQLSGPSGDFVEPYVLAHEYGHHISNLTGSLGQVRTQQGPESDAVRLELQADCYAGMWAGQATTTDDESGEALIVELTPEDIQEAVAAAKAVGDDRIQEQTTGRVDPEGWTHGSAEQRNRWFMIGYEQNSMEACDTFSADSL
jgi:predicted metalloprotease